MATYLLVMDVKLRMKTRETLTVPGLRLHVVEGLSPTEVLIGESTMREQLGIDVEQLLRSRCDARRTAIAVDEDDSSRENAMFGDLDSDHSPSDVAWRMRRLVNELDPNVEPDNLPPSVEPYNPDEVRLRVALNDLLLSAAKEGLPPADVEKLRSVVLGSLFDAFRVAPTNDPPAKFAPIHIDMEPGIEGMKSQHNRAFTPDEREFLERKLSQMCEYGHIATCGASRWTSPGFAVLKPGATQDTELMRRYRLVVNYRRPNLYTKPVQFPLIKLETLLTVIRGATMFGALDLSDGYWQLPLDEESQEYYKFQTGPRLYKSLRLVPGSRNAAAHFQACMVEALGDYVERICVVYMDDILIFGKTPSEFVENWRLGLERLHARGLKISAKKTTFYARELKYCGRVLTREGAKFDQTYIDTVLRMGKPSTLGELRSYLATVNWLRLSIPQFSEVVEPLQATLTQGLRYARVNRIRQPKNLPLHSACGWGAEQDAAFERVCYSVANTVTLGFPDDAKVTCVWSDACHHHYAGLVTQTWEDQLRLPVAAQQHTPLAFISGSFRDSSSRWTTT
ncbi:reverse transcriptase domain-containing protein [Silvimonas sp.]|uniref:reverse transcriptase family protein n=1 Tax=Silvimonas sp. TaxID=2650811 RepID=UPI0028402759|nr:reverse transcriptase domain-containing protein [Silvimonas sp.]MDR3426027.1 reverse transcriptase domain-containing protein [Silvimonas sp.]